MKREVSTRRLLRALFGSAGFVDNVLAPFRNTDTATPQDAKVLVIGAGTAGLTAAQLLHRAGFQVTVLEARDRIGGRTYADRSHGGIPLDMGASWIHGVRGNPLTALADKLNVKRFPSDYENLRMFDASNTPLSDAQIERYYALYEQLGARADKLAASSPPGTSMGTLLQQALNEQAASLKPEELIIAEALFNIEIEQDLAMDIDDLSGLHADDVDQFPGGDVLFPGSYEWLTTFMATGLDIQLQKPVSAIEYSDDGVRVVADGQQFQADFGVLTVPIGVLKAGSITFTPPLPADKLTAIKNIGVGVLNKLYLQFPKVFWDKNYEMIARVDPTAEGRFAFTVNMHVVLGEPILLMFNAAHYGAASEALSDAEFLAEAMRTLRGMYGDNIPEPTGYLRTNWLSDPYALCSYSADAVNVTPQDRGALARPLNNRLYFAGEATRNDHPATVHGALMSGQAAAEAIIDL